MQNHTRENPDTRDIVEIRTSTISGKGTFAKRDIVCGEYITTLSGEPVISGTDVSAICARLGITGDDPLQIDDSLFLILDFQSKTINHSCTPNAGVRNRSDLYAIRNITRNEEITYDYSTTSGVNDAWTMSCKCETNQCRGKIGNVLTIPFIVLNHYVHSNALPDFIKKQLQQIDHFERLMK